MSARPQVWLQRPPNDASFHETDPIGIAGGLNLYGFGGGDPVTYSDPYGLAAEECCEWVRQKWQEVKSAAREFKHHDDQNLELLADIFVAGQIVNSVTSGGRGGAFAPRNPVPRTLARVVPANVRSSTLARLPRLTCS